MLNKQDAGLRNLEKFATENSFLPKTSVDDCLPGCIILCFLSQAEDDDETSEEVTTANEEVNPALKDEVCAILQIGLGVAAVI